MSLLRRYTQQSPGEFDFQLIAVVRIQLCKINTGCFAPFKFLYLFGISYVIKRLVIFCHGW
jgi:hypothetical protein